MDREKRWKPSAGGPRRLVTAGVSTPGWIEPPTGAVRDAPNKAKIAGQGQIKYGKITVDTDSVRKPLEEVK